jgi:glycerol uptake facilitator-like aquaporin
MSFPTVDPPAPAGSHSPRGSLLNAEQQHRMLHAAIAPNFLDASIEYRRVFSELWGTFLLVVVAAGAGVVAAKSDGAVTLPMAVVAPGLMVMAIIYFMGTVSGAHLNPAVTLAFAVRRNFPWRRVPGYIGAQIVGGLAAALFVRVMFGTIGQPRRHRTRGRRDRHAGAGHGDPAHRGAREHDPRHRLRRA